MPLLIWFIIWFILLSDALLGHKPLLGLRIEEGGAVRWLYESRDITKYLRARFA